MMAPSTLITTKTLFPPRRPRLVLRQRLLQKLSRGLAQGHRLFLAAAPAGSGKTTLISEWLAAPDIHAQPSDGETLPAATPLQVAWLNLDAEDNDPIRFLVYAAAALDTIKAGVSADVLALLQTPQPPLRAALTVLINHFSENIPAILVLDDYHLIVAPEVHEMLAFLLDHLPPKLHLAVISRTDPPLPLARLRARNQLTELRTADLRFTFEETATFLNQVMDLNLSTSDIAALEDRTEGWIAGLQLAAIAMQTPPAPDGRDDAASFISAGFIAAFTGSDRYILDYLAEEVLRLQPEALQTFLLQTSILDILCGPLCDEMLGANDLAPLAPSSQQTLEHLERSNLFILPLDHERRWYRYHTLFAEFLRGRLQQCVPQEAIAALHRRAAGWYEANGHSPEAVKHALEAQDYDHAASLIETIGRATLMGGETRLIGDEGNLMLTWIQALPEPVIRARPRLCLVYTWAMLTVGRIEAVDQYLQEMLQTVPLNNTSLYGEAAALQALVANLRNDVPRAIQMAHQALAILPANEPFLRSLVALNLGLAYDMLGDMPAAIQVYSEATALARVAKAPLILLMADVQLADLKVLAGQWHTAAAIYQKAIEDAAASGKPLSVVSMAHANLGHLLYEWNDLEAAARHLTTCIELGRRWGSADMLVTGSIYLAGVRQAAGDPQGAADLIQEAEAAMSEPMFSPTTVISTRAYQARLWIRQGRLDAATRWSQEAASSLCCGPSQWCQTGTTTLARLYLAQGKPEQVFPLLEPLLQTACEGKRVSNQVEILALQALAWAALGHRQAGRSALRQALELAEPGGLVRVFVDEGEPMRLLLADLGPAKDNPQRGYVARLLAAFEQALPASAPSPNETLIEPLSEREIEVLHWISVGLSNQEIARKLFVAMSTVKTHINNIYSKLGVNSRTQALVQAKDLELLGKWNAPSRRMVSERNTAAQYCRH